MCSMHMACTNTEFISFMKIISDFVVVMQQVTCGQYDIV